MYIDVNIIGVVLSINLLAFNVFVGAALLALNGGMLIYNCSKLDL